MEIMDDIIRAKEKDGSVLKLCSKIFNIYFLR